MKEKENLEQVQREAELFHQENEYLKEEKKSKLFYNVFQRSNYELLTIKVRGGDIVWYCSFKF